MKRTNILLLLPILLIIGCSTLTGTEIARLSINEVSNKDNLIVEETSLDLIKDDEIYIWSEMNFEHEGNIALRFRIEILKDDEEYGGLELDPTQKNITIGEIKTTVMGKTKWRFSGKNSEIKIKEDGKYTFKTILIASENPTLIINKADLVLKM